MKKIILIALIFTPFLGFTQKAKKDIQTTNFEVNGVCEMCKARIEKTVFKIKGVKSVSWDIASHQLSLIYDASKTPLINIHNEIAAVGHDTDLARATDEVYNSLYMCCKYERKIEEKKESPQKN